MTLRLDQLLMDRGLATSLRHAQALILTGDVLVNDHPCTKAGTPTPADAPVRIRSKKGHPWVSRGGLKLDHGLKTWNISVRNRHCLDIGASTGGFTDVLLTHGAQRVYAVDVGYGQLAWKLVQDPRVVNLERTNVRSLSTALIPSDIDFLCLDASFVSLSAILPFALPFLSQESPGIALIKPQFEADSVDQIPKGIVENDAIRDRIVGDVVNKVQSLEVEIQDLQPSPILGSKGNREYLLLFHKAPSIKQGDEER
ncbi:MAG: TlyA family RNA methyltransferase [Magnetococcales bacterium]|nr:TlyA family RNA methyltransferase [Magnetococcales bacterium]